MRRRRAREAALQVLFQMDLGKVSLDDALATVASPEWPRDGWSFVVALTRGTQEHLAEIDATIARVAEHWSLERMATVDRNILRMAICELQMAETPQGVVINEAVELAKRFSTVESGKFVNGLLGRIVRSGVLLLVGQAADA